MASRKRIALIAHDNRKPDLLEWARFNRETLTSHELYATRTTGGLLADELDLPLNRFLSGPLGGDQQVGAAIAEGRVDFVIFFWDPLKPVRCTNAIFLQSGRFRFAAEITVARV